MSQTLSKNGTTLEASTSMTRSDANSRIEAKNRLIFALDFPNQEAALEAVKELKDSVNFYKIGWQLFMSGDAFELGRHLRDDLDKQVMLDLKFFDVPETVGLAVKNIQEWVTFATVQGYGSMVKAAVKNKNGHTKILGITVLTSLDQEDIEADGFTNIDLPQLVVNRAKSTLEASGNGVVASGLEAKMLRDQIPGDFLIVTPGIRLHTDQVPNDDQKRTVTPKEAFEQQADYIVVGRPIRDAPQGRRAAAEEIQATIHEHFGE